MEVCSVGPSGELHAVDGDVTEAAGRGQKIKPITDYCSFSETYSSTELVPVLRTKVLVP